MNNIVGKLIWNERLRKIEMSVRLVDKVVYSSMKDELNRTDLLMFFLDGHREDFVVVNDQSERYIGFITYHSLMSSNQIEDAILYDKVILNEEVWDCATKIIEEGLLGIVPVFDMNGTLIYFAEHDADLCGMIRKFDLCTR